MTPLACALPLLFALTAPPDSTRVAPIRDTNDVRHALVSFAMVTHGSAALRWAGVDRDVATISAAAITAAAGIGKELFDHARGERIDPIDLAWDLAGIALGVLLAGATQ